MKRSFIASIGAKAFGIATLTAAIATVPFVSSMPVLANLQQSGTAIAQNLQRQPKVELRLTADKKVVEQDQQGKPKITWQALQGKVVVKPGDVLRYTLNGENTSDRPVKNLVLTQPIPKQTKYVLNSVTPIDNSVTVTYSIDNGKTFVEKPTVQVKLTNGKVETRPAPAEFYTHVRLKFDQPIAPKARIAAAYQVSIR